MQFRKTISLLVLIALVTWTLSALCAPLPLVQGATGTRVLYRTMVVHHPAAHKCCPPSTMVVVVCYRMHGDGDCDHMRSCLPLPQDEAISGTAKYHDDGQARACATAHVSNLLVESPQASDAPWESAGLPHQRGILDLKTDLRV